ncbi:MAG: hypothetical protein KKA81_12930 [Bacteroidetes bacterium]|nr:hypothetical protein [Bacteroidota bacterium]
MLIIIDKKIPQEAKEKLKETGALLELETSNICYEAISGHPDIFFCKLGQDLVLAPNLPQAFLEILEKNSIHYIKGEFPVGEKYPATAGYNAVYAGNTLIHNFRYTDPAITRLGEDADLIHVNQGYARCNLVSVGKDRYITSDEAIAKVLQRFHKEVLYIDPAGIVLPGFKNGFFGGCCGILDDKIYLAGSLKYLKQGQETRSFLIKNGYEIVELYDGPLFDGGSIVFV